MILQFPWLNYILIQKINKFDTLEEISYITQGKLFNHQRGGKKDAQETIAKVL